MAAFDPPRAHSVVRTEPTIAETIAAIADEDSDEDDGSDSGSSPSVDLELSNM